jgi:hypothetical protein
MKEAMDERPSYLASIGFTMSRWENEQYLLEVFIKQLGITKQDLENDPSWVKAKVRELNIDRVLNENEN